MALKHEEEILCHHLISSLWTDLQVQLCHVIISLSDREWMLKRKTDGWSKKQRRGDNRTKQSGDMTTTLVHKVSFACSRLNPVNHTLSSVGTARQLVVTKRLLTAMAPCHLHESTASYSNHYSIRKSCHQPRNQSNKQLLKTLTAKLSEATPLSGPVLQAETAPCTLRVCGGVGWRR